MPGLNLFEIRRMVQRRLKAQFHQDYGAKLSAELEGGPMASVVLRVRCVVHGAHLEAARRVDQVEHDMAKYDVSQEVGRLLASDMSQGVTAELEKQRKAVQQSFNRARQ